MPKPLSGRVVVVTGASSGIGRATALTLARGGARLVLAARRGEVLAEVAENCLELGARDVLAIPTDISVVNQMEHLADEAVRMFGGIDVWVNCAGVLQFGRIDETPAEIIERLMEINVLGCFWGARAAVRQFRLQGEGTLINVSSALGVVAQPYASAYVASKFAVRGLGASLRQELRNEPNIHVSTVLPFAIDTPIYQRAANNLGRGVKPLWLRYGAQTVADTIVAVVKNPRGEVYAGKLGVPAAWAKRLLPPVTERLIGDAVEWSEITREPKAQSDGNLFTPARDGFAVSGGWGATTKVAKTVLIGGLAAGLLGAMALANRRHPDPRRSAASLEGRPPAA